MVKWTLIYTKQAQKDAKQIARNPQLKANVQTLLQLLQSNPYQVPLPYERLVGDLTGAYSRRINIRHRLVYQVLKEEKIVKIIRLWTHYE